MNILLLRFAGLFSLCFWLTSCLETQALALENILTALGSHLSMVLLNRTFYNKNFRKIFFFFNFHLILFVYFIITANQRQREWIDVVELGSSRCEVSALLCITTVIKCCCVIDTYWEIFIREWTCYAELMCSMLGELIITCILVQDCYLSISNIPKETTLISEIKCCKRRIHWQVLKKSCVLFFFFFWWSIHIHKRRYCPLKLWSQESVCSHHIVLLFHMMLH